MKNQIIICILALFALMSSALFANQNNFKAIFEKEIIDNGNEISEALAKHLVAKISSIEDIREISKNGVEGLSEKAVIGEASAEQILVLSLHKNDKEVMEALRKGRAVVNDELEYYTVGIIDGDNRVERSILYDVAMLQEKGESDQLKLLLEKIENRDGIAFRVFLSESIRFIENEILLKDILNRFLEDKRNAVRGAPSGTNYFLRVCDVAGHEFYSKVGLQKEPRLSLSNDDLETISVLYEKFISKRSEKSSSNERSSSKNSINTKVLTNRSNQREKSQGNNSTPDLEPKNKSSLPWIIAGVFVLGILVLLFKTFKGKPTS